MGAERDLDALAHRLAGAASRLKRVQPAVQTEAPPEEVDPSVALRRLEEAEIAVRRARNQLAELQARLEAP